MTNEELQNDPIFQKVMSIDLASLKARIEKRHGVTLDSDYLDQMRWVKAEMYYRQYLYFRAKHPGEQLVAFSADVDAFWHEHILDSAKYAVDCQTIFGGFLHHDPSIEKGTPRFVHLAELTKVRFAATFQPPRDPWQKDKTTVETQGASWPPEDFDYLVPKEEDFETCA